MEDPFTGKALLSNSRATDNEDRRQTCPVILPGLERLDILPDCSTVFATCIELKKYN
jgi:hypothetical protein